MSVAVNAGFAPNIIAMSVMIKVWSVIGTPAGSSTEIGAITQISEAVSPIMHNSCIFDFLLFMMFILQKIFKMSI